VERAVRYAVRMPPRAIFFDLDDTLLDTSGGLDEAWGLTCERFGPVLGIDAVLLRDTIRAEANAFWKDEAAVGHWRIKLMDARIHVVDLALKSLAADTSFAAPVAEMMESERTSRLRLFDDSEETLEAAFPIDHYFEAVVIEGEFGAGKPDPSVFHHALTATGTAPADAWHVGDNLYADIGGAQGVGSQGVWIHRDRLERTAGDGPTPDRVIGHLAELREALERLDC
jgi:putative hydrolase of the HAD superfamily